MRFGPTSLRLTSVLAKRLHRPALRADLPVSKQTIKGEISYVLKIPETDSYARYGEYEYELLKLCDGTRTPAEVAAAVMEANPEQTLEESDVVEFLDGMDPNAWERGVGEKNLAILEKIRDERESRVNQSSLLYIYFSAWDPDKLLIKVDRYLGWMFTRGFAIFSVALFATTFLIVAGDWARIRSDTGDFYNFTNKTAYDIWVFWFLLFLISGIHEFGHGLTCRHYGGEVHQMGFMLIYFTPSFYTDCTDMHMFDRTSKRLWTIFAGMWIEMVVCGISTLMWFFLPPGSFTGDLAYKMLLLTGVSGIFINMNPLMKFDGYFALSQFLEIDNLREDSFEYLGAWFRRTILRQPVDLPTVGRRKHRIFLTFGMAAFVYSVFLLTLVTVFFNNVFTTRFGDWGYLLTAGLFYLLMRKRLKRWVPKMLQGARQGWEKLMAWRMNAWQKAGAAALLIVLVVPPVPTQVATEFVLEPGQRADVRATVPGVLAQVRVREGENVARGAVLAELRNAEVEARLALVIARLHQATRAMLAARAQGDFAVAQQQGLQVEREQIELSKAAAERDALALRAPFAGVVTSSAVELRTGEYLNKGDKFTVLADRSRLRARILVRDWELEDVREGDTVKLSVRAYPLESFQGTVRQILPAAAADRPVAEPSKLERKGQELTNYIAVVLEFPNPEGTLREGLTGTAKIYGRRYPLAWKAARSGWRWVRAHVW